MKFRRGVAAAVVLFLQMISTSNAVFAQGLGTPCNGGDPDVDCPIDSWILVFAAIAIIYTCIKIKHVKTASL